MSFRSASYGISLKVQELLPKKLIEMLVRITVDELYDDNAVVDGTLFKRHVVATVNGKVCDGKETVRAARECPDSLGYLLPIVVLYENKGEDVAIIFMSDEIKDVGILAKDKGLMKFIDEAPTLNVEELRELIFALADDDDTYDTEE